jgi:4a-hydroxytetrahydrobiopterin dehydratase
MIARPYIERRSQKENGGSDVSEPQALHPRRGGIPPITLEQAEELQREVPAWKLHDEGRRIERTYWRHNFQEAFELVRQVAELAEAEGHHPEIRFEWGYVTVSLQTKKIKGLHENDFIMAGKIDRLDGGWRP